MTVFKTILKILNKLKGMLILYTVMLVSITVLNQTAGNNMTNFEETKPNVLIVNKNSTGTITNNFIAYVTNHSNIVDIDVNSEEAINDAIFYRDVNYVLYIPENFEESILSDKNISIEYKSSGDEKSSYTKMLVEKYIDILNVYKNYYQGDELNKKVNEILSINTQVDLKTNLDTTGLSSATRYFNFLNYAFLAGCVYCISMILSSLKEINVNKRTIVSSFNYKKYNFIVLIANALIIFFMWLLYVIISFILFNDLMVTLNGIAFIINSFIYAICSLTIGFLIGNITQNKNAIGGIVNVVALGTSFLCGCFVPFEYMPNYVIKISHILPTYYFVSNNEMIKSLEIFNFTTLRNIIINDIVIIIFSIAFILITNYINRRKQIIN